MQRVIFKLHSPRYPLLMHYNLESRRLLIHEKLHRRIHFTTRAIRWKNNLKIYKKKKNFLIGHESSVSPLEPHYYPPPCSNILLPPQTMTSRQQSRWHICNVVAVCRKTMPSSSSSSSHGHAAGLHQPPKITRAAPVKRAGQRPSIYRGDVPRIDHQLAPNYGSCTPSPLHPSIDQNGITAHRKWRRMFAVIDQKKKKKEGEGSKNGRMDVRCPSPLLSFLFVEIAEFKSDSRFKIFKY